MILRLRARTRTVSVLARLRHMACRRPLPAWAAGARASVSRAVDVERPRGPLAHGTLALPFVDKEQT